MDSLSENVKRGIRQKLRRGGWPGCAPLGYLNDYKSRTIVPDTAKGPLVRKTFELYAEGDLSLEDLRKEIEGWGLKSRTEKPLRIGALASLLKNPFYYGIMRFGGDIYEGSHPPLISRSVFDMAQDVFTQKSKPLKHGKISRSMLVSISEKSPCY